MNNRKRRAIFWSERPSCWNCAKLRRSKRIIHEDTLDKEGGRFSMSAPSFIDAIAAFHCDNYWFGRAPDSKVMFCGGAEHVFKK